MGYPGSRGPVYEFAKRWQQAQSDAPTRMAFVPMSFEMGEAFQFDWSCEYLFVGGLRKRLEAAHTAGGQPGLHAHRPPARPTRCCSTPMPAFAAFGGVPRRGIYDNMKTAVDKVGRQEPHVNARFEAMTGHYLFEPEFCNRAAGWGEGHRREERAGSPSWHLDGGGRTPLADLESLNAWLHQACWTPGMSCLTPVARVDDRRRLAAEQTHLMPNPAPFDGYVEQMARVTATSLIHYQRNRYSVPREWAHTSVSVRAYPTAWWWSAPAPMNPEQPVSLPRSFERGQTSRLAPLRQLARTQARRLAQWRPSRPCPSLCSTFRPPVAPGRRPRDGPGAHGGYPARAR